MNQHVFGSREDPVAGDPRETAAGDESTAMGLLKGQLAALLDTLETLDVGQVVEGVPALANPRGVMLLARRRDTTTTAEVPNDGDVIALNADSKGRLYLALEAADIEIGAVEIKDGTTDTRAKVLAASTASGATDTPMVVALHPTSTAKGSGAIDAVTTRVVLATDDPLVAKTSGLGKGVKVTHTRAANTNTYGAGDVLGPAGAGTASMEFANITPMAGEFMITSASLERHVAALISGETSYTLHLFNVTQPSAQADEATFTLAAGDRAAYLDSINLGTPVDLVDTLFVKTDGINKQVTLTSTSIFGVLVTVGSYAAASGSVLAVTLHGVPV